MKSLIIIACMTAVVGILLSVIAAERPAGNAQLRHVVSFKFKESATSDQIKEIEQAFKELKNKVPGIVRYEWGTNVSPEKLNKGFTHCFILTFNSEKDRDAYLVHPDHKAFGQKLGPILADVFVIDFVVQR